MKKLINTPESVLEDALAGVAAAHPELAVDVPNRVITRAVRPAAPKVALVSGGGSGHEPLHGGFVGPGMLDAACPGEVFTSPVPDQVLTAARAVDSGAGVLLVVKNYTGDVMNFRLAAELAAEEGIEVRTVLVDDDVAVEDSTWTAGRRGTGATVLVEKISRRAGRARRTAGGGRRRRGEGQRGLPFLRGGAHRRDRPGGGPSRASSCPRTRSRWVSASTASRAGCRVKLRPARELAAEVVDTVLADHDLTAA